jgi:tetratricopeptide (TPR) repeat protein
MKDDNYIFEMFLDGRLEGESLIQFQDKLKTDPDFAHRFGLYERMDDLILRMHSHVFGIKKISENIELPDIKDLEKIQEDIDGYLKTKKNTPETAQLKTKLNAVYEEFRHNQVKKSRKSALLGIAASLALLAGLSVFLPRYFFQDTSNEELFNTYYSVYPCVFNKRGCNQEGESVTWKKAVSKYQEKKFTEALGFFKLVSDSAGRNDEADLFAGICYIELDSLDQAVNTLVQITKRQRSLVHDHALWYLGLAYIRLDNHPEAVQAFSSIENSSSEFYEKAREVLSVLE